MEENQKKKRKRLKEELVFYLDYYNKVDERMKREFDWQINSIIEALKELKD